MVEKMRKGIICLVVILLILSLANAARAKEDHPLSRPGVLVIKIGKSTGSAGVSIQKDGKILVSEPSFVDNQKKQKLILIRRNADGSPDQTFGKAGMVITKSFVNSFSVHSEGLVLQEDGKAVLVGNGGSDRKNKNTGKRNTDILVVRYNTDGQLDEGFNGSGWIVTDINGDIDGAYGVAVQKDQKIVVVGKTLKWWGGYHFVVLRYNKDGTLDRGFGKRGKVITRVDSKMEGLARAVAIQPDGKILVAGRAMIHTSSDMAFVRYTPDGALDTAFGTKGKVMKRFVKDEWHISSVANAVAIQPDGKIILGVNLFHKPEKHLNEGRLIRYNADGRLDLSFGTSGSVTVNNRGYYNLYSICSVALQNDGKILFTGASYDTEKRSYTVVVGRYNVDGSPDISFGNNGLTNIPMGKSRAVGRKIAIQSNGKIVVVGNAGTIDSNAISHWANRYPPDLVIFRLKTDGRIDKYFGSVR
jgi:uncharacterized delta-60 repeat protein